ncbi:penicillin-binding transpeptidase domain-containing protein [Streptomyces asoensis]|uniref:penicillin-binding transpeptidase domain-containing protein n=1 Tax=Streptomyces asoensis TaxID=249586 RepID=UPI0033C2DE6E
MAAVSLAVCAGGYTAADVVGLFNKTGPLSEVEVRSTSSEFLAAWESGEIGAAADLTDDKKSTAAALSLFRQELGKGLTIDLRQQKNASVRFSVTVKPSDTDKGFPWTYSSSLRLVRDTHTGEPRVDWSPNIVHPQLAAGDRLTVVRDNASSMKILDREGTELTVQDYPSLASVLPDLAKRYASMLGGEPAGEVRILRKDGRRGSVLHVLTQGKRVELRTTLSSQVQHAAEEAVKKYPESSAVAIDANNGNILAFANNRRDGFNAAFLGKRAPGSTMKIVTSAALLEKGLVDAARPAPCPSTKSYEGATFQNLKMFEIASGTFSDAFIRSCNTTFVSFAEQAGADGLANAAKEVFGLGLEWHSGVATFDGQVPPADGPERAAAMIGQGKVQVNPLNMASVAATAYTGKFRQPLLVAPDLDGRPIATASRSLPPDVADQLRQMMRRTATAGTAVEAMRGLEGDIGAKTGSAEVDKAKISDSWFTGFRDGVAAAATVEAGGHGGDAAGPVVRDILEAGY